MSENEWLKAHLILSLPIFGEDIEVKGMGEDIRCAVRDSTPSSLNFQAGDFGRWVPRPALLYQSRSHLLSKNHISRACKFFLFLLPSTLSQQTTLRIDSLVFEDSTDTRYLPISPTQLSRHSFRASNALARSPSFLNLPHLKSSSSSRV